MNRTTFVEIFENIAKKPILGHNPINNQIQFQLYYPTDALNDLHSNLNIQNPCMLLAHYDLFSSQQPKQAAISTRTYTCSFLIAQAYANDDIIQENTILDKCEAIAFQIYFHLSLQSQSQTGPFRPNLNSTKPEYLSLNIKKGLVTEAVKFTDVIAVEASFELLEQYHLNDFYNPLLFQ
jgi:hypothetical protein